VSASHLRVEVPIQTGYLVEKVATTSRRTRAAVHRTSADGRSNRPVKYYELGREGRDIVSMKCRAQSE
jgi:hypothetical protein